MQNLLIQKSNNGVVVLIRSIFVTKEFCPASHSQTCFDTLYCSEPVGRSSLRSRRAGVPNPVLFWARKGIEPRTSINHHPDFFDSNWKMDKKFRKCKQSWWNSYFWGNYFRNLTGKKSDTVFENHPKCRIWFFLQFWYLHHFLS